MLLRRVGKGYLNFIAHGGGVSHATRRLGKGCFIGHGVGVTCTTRRLGKGYLNFIGHGGEVTCITRRLGKGCFIGHGVGVTCTTRRLGKGLEVPENEQYKVCQETIDNCRY